LFYTGFYADGGGPPKQAAAVVVRAKGSGYRRGGRRPGVDHFQDAVAIARDVVVVGGGAADESPGLDFIPPGV
jgi:hypothetical protein